MGGPNFQRLPLWRVHGSSFELSITSAASVLRPRAYSRAACRCRLEGIRFHRASHSHRPTLGRMKQVGRWKDPLQRIAPFQITGGGKHVGPFALGFKTAGEANTAGELFLSLAFFFYKWKRNTVWGRRKGFRTASPFEPEVVRSDMSAYPCRGFCCVILQPSARAPGPTLSYRFSPGRLAIYGKAGRRGDAAEIKLQGTLSAPSPPLPSPSRTLACLLAFPRVDSHPDTAK